ncbi:hypothetical protein V1520DRAFT_378036 [Lipomyces starkeyi]
MGQSKASMRLVVESISVRRPYVSASIASPQSLIWWSIVHLFSNFISTPQITNVVSQTNVYADFADTIDLAKPGQDGFKMFRDYFHDFYGAKECELSDGSLMRPYCATKEKLLESLSGGGRIGFSSAFHPLNCEYRWFDTKEICMILDRFDAVIFIGGRRMTSNQCRCEAQYTNPQCGGGPSGIGNHYIVDSTEILEVKDEVSKPGVQYVCNRVFHEFVAVDSDIVGGGTLEGIESLFATYHKKSKPIPIILQSIGDKTTDLLDIILKQINQHEPNPNHRPLLWLGATSAGHLKPPGVILDEGNNSLYYFTAELAKRAKDRGLDVLNLYNLTLQADSYDGTMYGQDVSLTTTMMIINWLSRIESL